MALPTKPTIRTMIRDRVSMYTGAASMWLAPAPKVICANRTTPTVCTKPSTKAMRFLYRTALHKITAHNTTSMPVMTHEIR